MTPNPLLFLAGLSSAAAALLHLLIVVKGASWYRRFGAGERFALAAERGAWWPHAVTIGIALVLAFWATCALSSAGGLELFPQQRSVLLAVAAIYLLRGAALLPLLLWAPSKTTRFDVWSSVLCLAIGALHAGGVLQAWEPQRGDWIDTGAAVAVAGTVRGR